LFYSFKKQFAFYPGDAGSTSPRSCEVVRHDAGQRVVVAAFAGNCLRKPHSNPRLARHIAWPGLEPGEFCSALGAKYLESPSQKDILSFHKKQKYLCAKVRSDVCHTTLQLDLSAQPKGTYLLVADDGSRIMLIRR
jgi:hypothetical protein